MCYRSFVTVLMGMMATIMAMGQEPYWKQTFDEKWFAEADANTEKTYTVEGQGEWRFYLSFVATKEETQQIKDGSNGDLRIKKKGGYVITPLLDQGVKMLTLDENRTKKYLNIYLSEDGGETWKLVTSYSKNTTLNMTIYVRNRQANRIKIENPNNSNDCDIDNLCIYPMTDDDTDPVTPDNGKVETFYCSPNGNDDTADGTLEKPFYSLQRAVDMAGPSDTVMMQAGTYQYDARVNIANCGTAEKRITLKCNDGRAVLDFSKMPYHKHSDNPQQGIRLTGSYWHFYHIDICNASDNGLLIERESTQGYPENQAHNNLIEQCNFYKNGDTGLQIKNLGSFNYIVNCDSYLNCDEDQGDADGFAPKISVGDGNYFYGCRAWANSDDGWDVFYKKDSGQSDNVSVILENCISYKNGFLDLNTIAPQGNGNGIKMGSNQGAMNMFLNRCLAICNKAKGFDQNHNAGDIIMNNCTGMTLTSIDSKSYSYRIYEDIATNHEVRLTNCIAINDNDATDKRDKEGNVKASEHGKYGQYGRFEVDETFDRMSIITCEFQKADPTQFICLTNHEELIGPRQADGSLPETTFAHLKEGSSLIDKGSKIESTTYRGIPVNGISYKGNSPDLGAYESAYQNGTCIETISQQNGIKLLQTEGGMLLLTVAEAKGVEACQAMVYDTTGQQLLQHSFYGSTTSLSLPYSTQRILILKVIGQQGQLGSAKILCR